MPEENWKVVFTREAVNDLDKLDGAIRKRVLRKIKRLSKNFERITPLPLSAKWKGFFKLRVGDWRVIYEIEIPKKRIVIHLVDHRRDIYRKRL